MWQAMFVEQIPWAEKILRTVLVYALILLLFRLTGKRGLANLNTFDFVVIFLLSNVVQNAVIGNDQSLVGGGVGAITLIAVNSVVNRLVDINPRIARLLEGSSTTVIEHGQIVERAMHRLGVRRNELDHAVRTQNGDDIGEIEDGRLAPSGQLVLTLKHDEQSATKADIADLAQQVRRLERFLSTDPDNSHTGLPSRPSDPARGSA
jgi:uncharacterized membrane protein YcaP (DUF421 family)